MSGSRTHIRVEDPDFEEAFLRWFEESDTEFSGQDGDLKSNITTRVPHINGH